MSGTFFYDNLHSNILMKMLAEESFHQSFNCILNPKANIDEKNYKNIKEIHLNDLTF